MTVLQNVIQTPIHVLGVIKAAAVEKEEAMLIALGFLTNAISSQLVYLPVNTPNATNATKNALRTCSSFAADLPK